MLSATDFVVRANALDNSVRLYRLDKGKRSQLGMKEGFTFKGLQTGGVSGGVMTAEDSDRVASVRLPPLLTALDADFTSEGQVTALFGHSGSGKTTLFRMVIGEEDPFYENNVEFAAILAARNSSSPSYSAMRKGLFQAP